MKKLLLIVVALLVVLGVASVAAFSYLSAPANPQTTESISFVIPKGKGLNWVADTLEKQGIIRSSIVFRLLAMKRGVATKIQAGTYTLSRSTSIADIFQTLQLGTNDSWVTMLEGWRNEEIAEELGKTLGESFDTQEFLALAKSKEGYLFPDTYLFPKDIEPATVVSYLENTFNKRVTDQMHADITKQERTLADVITLASIVEREGNSKESKTMIAGILKNRVDKGAALQADATLQYAKGYDTKEKSWWVPPLVADKELKSPYNTYKNPGLPPGPIANPGLDSISAAIYPAETDYWYYITGDDGKMYYAKTLDEHNANVNRYLR